MNDEQHGMSDEFASRMRQGLSTMAVRERVRERSRNRAIAGGALAAVVVATVAVLGSQALGQLGPERDQAGPAVTQTPTTAPTGPTEPGSTEPAPSETAPSEPTPTDTAPTPPPGFAGVAAGEPLVVDTESCGDGCGDAGAAGDGTHVERRFDIYLLCEGSGSVSYGGAPWVDCSEHPAGSGFVQFDVIDTFEDGDPQVTASSDFDGQLSVVEAGQPPVGSGAGGTATVWVTCIGSTGSVMVGGVLFDCSTAVAPEGEIVVGSTIAAWGVPIRPGEIAPRVEGDRSGMATVSFVVER